MHVLKNVKNTVLKKLVVRHNSQNVNQNKYEGRFKVILDLFLYFN